MKNNMWKAVYFGYSREMLEYLIECPFLSISQVVGVKGRIIDKYYDTLHKNKLQYMELEDRPTLYELENICKGIQIILVYKYEYIFPEDFVKKYNVFNFHGGDIRTNRGAHAVVWSILKRESRTCLTLYKLTGGIDEGKIVDEYWVQLNEDENVNSLNKKLILGIPYLLKQLQQCLEGKKEYTLCLNGIYRRKVQEEDYTIKVEEDSIKEIKAKICSQALYDGAICVWNKKKIRIKHYTHERINVNSDNRVRKILEMENRIVIIDGKNKIELLFES